MPLIFIFFFIHVKNCFLNSNNKEDAYYTDYITIDCRIIEFYVNVKFDFLYSKYNKFLVLYTQPIKLLLCKNLC